MQTLPRILVALPAYNEAKYVGSLILKARQHATEIMVLDDGSEDDTSRIAMLAGAIVLKHQRNRGKGAAIRTILEEAKKRKPDMLVVLDADYQHDPDEIPFLLQPLFEGYDVVIGSREQQRRRIPFYRRVGQRILSRGTSVLSGRKIYDSQSGFRAFSSRAIDELKLKQNGFAIESEMISAATEKGLKVKEVPVSVTYTEDSSTLNPISHGVGVLASIIVMISERRPLFFFGLFGAISIALGIAAGIKVVDTFITYSGVIPPGSVLLSALLLIVGTFSVFTGMVLHTLARRKGSMDG